jgi:hypothetical protein
MKIAQQRLLEEEEIHLQTVLSSDQYAKYQSRRAALRHNWRPGSRPPKR